MDATKMSIPVSLAYPHLDGNSVHNFCLVTLSEHVLRPAAQLPCEWRPRTELVQDGNRI